MLIILVVIEKEENSANGAMHRLEPIDQTCGIHLSLLTALAFIQYAMTVEKGGGDGELKISPYKIFYVILMLLIGRGVRLILV